MIFIYTFDSIHLKFELKKSEFSVTTMSIFVIFMAYYLIILIYYHTVD